MKMKKNLLLINNVLFGFARRTLLASTILCFLFLGQALDLKAQLASCHSKFVGNIWYNGNMPLNYDQYFNQVTPENATKWSAVQGSGPNSWNWGPALAMYNYSQSRNIPFKFHTLVWGNQYPSWLDNSSNKAQAVENWIREAGAMFPDAEFIDVVNECLPNHAQPSWRSEIGGANGLYGTGWDWVVWSFEKARQYFPNSKLLINDYNILNNHWNNDLEVLCDIVNILNSRGLIDGIGLQAHGLANVSGADVSARLSRIASRCPGVPIYISELDIDIADDNQQRNKLAELFPLFWNNPNIHGITFWGYVQGHTWIPNSHLIRSDGSERPAMVWLKDYLDCSGNGQFNGVYSFVAQHSGKAVDTYNFGTSNGTNIVQWNYWGGDAQRFQVSHLGNGWHRISPVVAPGQALDVSGISTANGANIHTWAWGSGTNQQWRFENDGNGNWKIIARHSGKCLDVEEISTADGANIHQWDCISGAQNQAFELVPHGNASIASNETLKIFGISANDQFNVFPNPAENGDFTVNIPARDSEELYRLSIFSIEGQKVYETDQLTKGVHEIRSGLKPGIYFLRTNDKSNFKKLIVR